MLSRHRMGWLWCPGEVWGPFRENMITYSSSGKTHPQSSRFAEPLIWSWSRKVESVCVSWSPLKKRRKRMQGMNRPHTHTHTCTKSPQILPSEEKAATTTSRALYRTHVAEHSNRSNAAELGNIKRAQLLSCVWMSKLFVVETDTFHLQGIILPSRVLLYSWVEREKRGWKNGPAVVGTLLVRARGCWWTEFYFGVILCDAVLTVKGIMTLILWCVEMAFLLGWSTLSTQRGQRLTMASCLCWSGRASSTWSVRGHAAFLFSVLTPFVKKKWMQILIYLSLV